MYVSDLVTGDVLLSHWKSPLGAVIAWRTGSPYSHAALCVHEGDGAPVAYGLGVDGLESDRVEALLVEHGDRIDVFRLPREVRTPQSTRMLADLLDRLQCTQAVAYHLEGLLHHFWPRWWWAKSAADPEDMPARAICSEFVSACLRRTHGVDPCPLWSDAWTTPGDLARGGVLHFVGALR